MFLHIQTKLADSAGFVKFILRKFQMNETQADEMCCADELEKNCHCEMYAHVCVGVGFEHRKYHRDCSLLHHNSPIIAGTQLYNTYNVSIPFDVRWPVKNVSLLVEMRHKPSKAIIFRSENFLQLSPLSNDMQQITEEKGNSEIVYSVKVECEEHYYGPECAIYCNPNIGSFHFKCSLDGQRMCEDGWSGKNCDNPICANGCVNGHCTSPGVCKCRSGWRGINCDRCKVQKGCKHGYCKKANECICEKNWGGMYCEKDLDYCFHNSPCVNGGRCTSGGLQNYYYCNCTKGFTGQNCEIKVDPCANVDCGSHGQCLVSWESEGNYKCQCDDIHYGDHCQYSVQQTDEKKNRLHLMDEPESCRLSDSEYMPNGFSWATADCRNCVCQKGEITCSEKRCEPRDCYHNDSNSGKPVVCPKRQQCVIITEDECLKEKCTYPRGRCLSWLQISSEVARRICREQQAVGSLTVQGCARLNLEFDVDNLLQGTTAGDVCFHLLLDVNTANITHIGFECKLTSSNMIQVDIISLQFMSDVTMAKEFLKNRLRNRLTASQILHAITRIEDYHHNSDDFAWDSTIIKNIASATSTKGTASLTMHQMLIIIICLMILIILILLNICLLKNPNNCPRQRCSGILRNKSDVLELRLQPPTRIYTMQSVIKNDKRISENKTDFVNQSMINALPFSYEMKNKHSSMTDSLDSGIADHESEKNERNARILERQRIKSKLWSLESDSSILNPISLHLVGGSTQPLISRSYQC